MADTKISGLSAVTTPASTDEFPVNQAGSTKKVTLAQVKSFVTDPRSASTTNQVISASTVTYLNGSGILIPSSGLVAGQVFRWYIALSKTAAGTATPVWTFRSGANRTTADTTVNTITGTAQVATSSGTLIIITLLVESVGASGLVVGGINTGAASFGIGGSARSSTYNNASEGGKYMGICVNTGASAVWTIYSVMGEVT